jgi:hypothetical protein
MNENGACGAESEIIDEPRSSGAGATTENGACGAVLD